MLITQASITVNSGVPGVTDAPEHRPQHVVGHDEQAAAAADADVLHRFGKGLLRRVQKAGKGLGSGQ